MTESPDAGELLARVDTWARRAADGVDARGPAALIGARDALAEAVAALDALLACVPDGQKAVPEVAFRTAAGRALRDHAPERFRRDELAAYRAQLANEGQAIRRRLGELADPAFHARTAKLADTLVQSLRQAPATVPPSQQPVRFDATADARRPYAAVVEGARWTVRINEFPEDPSLYSLLIDGVVVEELMAWPPAWQRPDP